MTKLTSITQALSTDSQMHVGVQRTQDSGAIATAASAEDAAQGADAADGAALAHKAADRDFQSALRQARSGKDDFASLVQEQADGSHLPAIPSTNALYNCTVSLATPKPEQDNRSGGSADTDVEGD
ncbi:MAG: hypothetical protein EPO01_01835 [Aquabacterium sp.]|nr:MAG: hypothetical protein EPO12_03280 [Aquabacterium sp.]TAL26474.1 MAG: hypothetical protein EPO01_01835 [Aquabacterium sp.]